MNEETKRLFSALKPFVHDVQKYNALIAYIDYCIGIEQKTLEALDDPTQIYRTQGKIMSLKRIKQLREHVVASEK